MAGAGIRGGVSRRASDAFGRRARGGYNHRLGLLHTALHLLGFDHERLTVYHNGLDRRLTDVQGHVVQQVLT